MPDFGKSAVLKLIFKPPGNKHDPGDYRPISLLSFVAKCIEYFVNKQLTDYIKRNEILTEHQFGFRSGNSTTFLMLQLVPLCLKMSTERHFRILNVSFKTYVTGWKLTNYRLGLIKLIS